MPTPDFTHVTAWQDEDGAADVMGHATRLDAELHYNQMKALGGPLRIAFGALPQNKSVSDMRGYWQLHCQTS